MPSASSASRSSKRTRPSCAACPSTASSRPMTAFASGKYEGSRPLFVYVKKQHVGVVPGIDKFVAEYVSAKAMSKDGYLARKGLVALPKAEADKVAASAKGMTGAHCRRREVSQMPKSRPVRAGWPRQLRRSIAPAADRAGARRQRTPACDHGGASVSNGRTSISLRSPYWSSRHFLPGGHARAAWHRRSAAGALHSLPIYHGLLAAVAVLVPMLVVLCDRDAGRRPIWPSPTRSTSSRREVATDALKRGTAARDIHEPGCRPIRRGQPDASDQAGGRELYRARSAWGHWLVFAGGVALGLLGLALIISRITARLPVAQQLRALRPCRARRCAPQSPS